MIDFIKIKDREEGQREAHDLLKDLVNGQTLLVLSGGTSLDYQKMIVEPADIIPGAICVFDERYGRPFHKDSNELLLRNAGIKQWADKNCIESYKILSGRDFLATAIGYEKVIEGLFKKFPKKVGVTGVGADLHTAGIFPYSVSGKSPNFVEAETVDDVFPRRITLTLRALGEFTNFVILMFGSGKQEALRIILDERENDMRNYPAIFYRKSKIPAHLITDIGI